MKKLLILTIMMFFTVGLHAQADIPGLVPSGKKHVSEIGLSKSRNTKIDPSASAASWSRMAGLYLECGMHAGSAGFGMGLIGIRYRFNHHWMVGISMLAYQQKPANTPADFRPGTGSFFYLSSGNQMPMVSRSDLSLTLGRNLKMSSRSWFSMEGGISMLKGEKATFSRRSVVTADPLLMLIGISGTNDNYSMSRQMLSVAGAVVRTDLNFKVSPSLIISTGVYKNFNSLGTPVSYQLRFLTGPWLHK